MTSDRQPGTILTAPTAFLPSLAQIRQHSRADIIPALDHIRDLYWPLPSPAQAQTVPVPLIRKLGKPNKTRVHRLIHDTSVPDSGYASAEEEEDELDAYEGDEEGSFDPDTLRADPFERTFAIKWLTGFISRSDVWISAASDSEDEDGRYELMDDVTSLLTAFAVDDKREEALTREFSFPRGDGRVVEVELNDAPLSDSDHTSVGLQSWASSILLAERMCADPEEFGLVSSEKSLRVLELGAGTGLLSIVAAKLLTDADAQIVATDYHPDVLSNLAVNISTNFPSPFPSTPEAHALDWQYPEYTTPLDAPFEIILAADVIYHPDHAQWIRRCVEKLLLQPTDRSEGKGGIFWLIVPLRSTGRHEGISDTVDDIFPDARLLLGEEGEWKLAILEREEVRKQEGVGRADEGGYKLFKIGWQSVGAKSSVF